MSSRLEHRQHHQISYNFLRDENSILHLKGNNALLTKNCLTWASKMALYVKVLVIRPDKSKFNPQNPFTHEGIHMRGHAQHGTQTYMHIRYTQMLIFF